MPVDELVVVVSALVKPLAGGLLVVDCCERIFGVEPAGCAPGCRCPSENVDESSLLMLAASGLKTIDGWCASGNRLVFVDERNDAEGELLAELVGIFGSVRWVGVAGAWKLVCGEK